MAQHEELVLVRGGALHLHQAFLEHEVLDAEAMGQRPGAMRAHAEREALDHAIE